jgi:hypothetical protein
MSPDQTGIVVRREQDSVVKLKLHGVNVAWIVMGLESQWFDSAGLEGSSILSCIQAMDVEATYQHSY